MGLLKESFTLAASDADILAAPSILAALPSSGQMMIEASGRVADGTNFGTISLQLPGGDVPFTNLLIPANALSTAHDVMNKDTQLTITLAVMQGGHVGLSYVESGSAQTLIIVTFMF